MSYLIPICNSFKDGGFQERLKFYTERNVSKGRLNIELVPCPFYNEGRRCGLERGLIGKYIKGYPTGLRTYEKGNGELVEIERPLEILSLK